MLPFQHVVWGDHSSILLHAYNSGSKRTQLGASTVEEKVQGAQLEASTVEEKVQGAGSWWASMLATPAIKQTALMAENLTSDTPRIWCDQNLLRILTERGRGTIPTLSKWKIILNLCLPCPDHTTLSLGRVRCLCGGCSSFTPTRASNILH